LISRDFGKNYYQKKFAAGYEGRKSRIRLKTSGEIRKAENP
jgi:hypothetical protein